MSFTWDASTGRYRAAGGHLVAETAVRRALDQVLDAQAVAMRAATQQLIDGGIDLATWQLRMQAGVKASHLVGLSVANGGWNNLGFSEYGWVGQRIREQYRFLNGFARDLAMGRQLLNGSALARADMYAQAGRQTHRAAQHRLARAQGMEQERNQLGAADHCAGCRSQTSRGWVALGSLVPTGSRECLSRCHCSIAYREKPAAA